ncbi:hypothetical protein PAAG_11573 [Paracoccidioides lutzii Pb01]|uniref:Uncharacterized protein n=1 Tax=Paracoccidioides lutzii (strain ATCC MYA-826 / Pb01) TaxID=502779 RepID=A0A0A2V5X5_PARBA|nr:hypothetical protein PAAG_11573 [Paracoccidioides lutzii Pb01]KGQ01722.1 hypothetical protein PAAG_11573 [Paracoccidioides lutzii Pb01]
MALPLFNLSPEQGEVVTRYQIYYEEAELIGKVDADVSERRATIIAGNRIQLRPQRHRLRRMIYKTRRRLEDDSRSH